MRCNFRTHPMLPVLASLVVAFSMAFAGTAVAGGGHHHRHGHGALHAAVAGLAVYGAISHARHYGGHHAGRHHPQHGGHHGRGLGGGRSGYYSDGGCHTVYKHGYYHGREARIGGTQCYDRYGNPYIVLGSRYVIEYY